MKPQCSYPGFLSSPSSSSGKENHFPASRVQGVGPSPGTLRPHRAVGSTARWGGATPTHARGPAPSFKYTSPAGASSSPRTQDGGVWTCTEDVSLVGGVAAAAAGCSRGPERPGPGPGSGGQFCIFARASWRRQPGGAAAASAVSVIAAAAAAAPAASAAAAAAAATVPGGRAPGPAGRSGARWDWRRLEAGGGRVLQGRRDPCVPQTHLEQQPGGARVPARRAGGEKVGPAWEEGRAWCGLEGVAGLEAADAGLQLASLFFFRGCARASASAAPNSRVPSVGQVDPTAAPSFPEPLFRSLSAVLCDRDLGSRPRQAKA